MEGDFILFLKMEDNLNKIVIERRPQVFWNTAAQIVDLSTSESGVFLCLSLTLRNQFRAQKPV